MVTPTITDIATMTRAPQVIGVTNGTIGAPIIMKVFGVAIGMIGKKQTIGVPATHGKTMLRKTAKNMTRKTTKKPTQKTTQMLTTIAAGCAPGAGSLQPHGADN